MKHLKKNVALLLTVALLVTVLATVPESETQAAFRPSGYVGKLLTRLNEGGSETSFRTTPGTAPDGSSLSNAKIGDYIVLTINPGGANEEKISATAVSVSGTTATWTVGSRGLSFTATTTVSANVKQHAIGETVIISDDDHFLSTQYAAKDEGETITGSWIFPTPTLGGNAATKSYVDGAAFGGIGNASETATGTVEIATAAEAAAGTTNGSLGRLVLPASNATSTFNTNTAANVVPVTGGSGTLDQGFIPATITKNLTLSGNVAFSGSSITGLAGKSYLNTSLSFLASNQASTTVFSMPIAAGSLSTNNYYHARLHLKGVDNGNFGNCTITYDIGYGNASTTFVSDSTNNRFSGYFDITLAANASASAQLLQVTRFETATTTDKEAQRNATTTTKYATPSYNSANAGGINFIVSLVGDANACWFDPNFVAAEYFK